ncbi:Hypothetical predicted protein [Cloeon dipterum]|uniref:Uncharacterized protein n=1 Tax=Cloeon dipterum TaxID=197152 RepID=A0A8S1DZZ3_9INSE|nr:Hypothetical predicted protein [Cloeon dipterum]
MSPKPLVRVQPTVRQPFSSNAVPPPKQAENTQEEAHAPLPDHKQQEEIIIPIPKSKLLAPIDSASRSSVKPPPPIDPRKELKEKRKPRQSQNFVARPSLVYRAEEVCRGEKRNNLSWRLIPIEASTGGISLLHVASLLTEFEEYIGTEYYSEFVAYDRAGNSSDFRLPQETENAGSIYEKAIELAAEELMKFCSDFSWLKEKLSNKQLEICALESKESAPVEEDMESNKKNPKCDQTPDSESEKRLEFNGLTRLDEKLNFIEQNRGDIPPVLFAAKYADEEVCRKLIADGADVSKILDKIGANALHYVGMNISSGSELVKLFHRHGAKIDDKDKNKQTPLEYALQKKNYEVSIKLFELLKEKVNFNGNILDWCINLNALEFCKFVFEKDASLSKVKTDNLLIRAVERADEKLCRWLFKACLADVDLDSDQDSNWKEEILFAAAKNLEHGAKITHFLLGNYEINLEGTSLYLNHTPYTQAMAMGNSGVANALLIHGAILEVDIDPETARQIYRNMGNEEETRESSTRSSRYSSNDN